MNKNVEQAAEIMAELDPNLQEIAQKYDSANEAIAAFKRMQNDLPEFIKQCEIIAAEDAKIDAERDGLGEFLNQLKAVLSGASEKPELDPVKVDAFIEELNALDEGVHLLMHMAGQHPKNVIALLRDADKKNNEAIDEGRLTGDELAIGLIMQKDLPKAIDIVTRIAEYEGLPVE